MLRTPDVSPADAQRPSLILQDGDPIAVSKQLGLHKEHIRERLELARAQDQDEHGPHEDSLQTTCVSLAKAQTPSLIPGDESSIDGGASAKLVDGQESLHLLRPSKELRDIIYETLLIGVDHSLHPTKSHKFMFWRFQPHRIA